MSNSEKRSTLIRGIFRITSQPSEPTDPAVRVRRHCSASMWGSSGKDAVAHGGEWVGRPRVSCVLLNAGNMMFVVGKQR